MTGITKNFVNMLASALSVFNMTSLPIATVLLTALVPVLLLLLLVWYFSPRNCELRKLPGPKPVLPIIGSAPFMNWDSTNMLDNMIQFGRKFPGLYHLRLGFDFVILNTPEAAEAIFSSNRHIDKGLPYQALQPWLGEGLLISQDLKWHKRRKMLTPAFHFGILDNFVDVFNEQSFVLVNKLRATRGKTADIYPMITKATLDIICEAAMGVKIGAQNGSRSDYVQAVHDIGDIFFQRFINPWLNNEFIFRCTSLYRKQQKCLKLLHGFTDSVIQARRQELADSEASPSNDAKRLAFLDLLLASTIDEKPLSDADIREEVDTFMFEGHDTTASAASWTLYNLGRFPDIQARAYAEVRDILGEDPTEPISRANLSQLRYLEMVIKETMRLFPPVPKIGRRLASDVNINGYNIPGHCMITLFVYGIHRDPRHWPEPDRFDPERFSPENSEGRHPYAFVPFSAGPRNCIGQKFAMMEEKVLMASVLRAFEIRSIDNYEDLSITGNLILRLNGPLRLSFTPRH